jgi:allantoinase
MPSGRSALYIMFDVVIRQGTLVDGAALYRGDIAITDGQIVAIGKHLSGPSRSEIDATGLHLLPGLIDAHVHCNEPGRSDWEGFATASAALAAGGATTFFDMPLNAHPPTTDQAAFDQKYAAAQQSARIDFALWGGIVPGNLGELAKLAERGVIGFKAFMSDSGIEDFAAVDDVTLFEGMQIAAELGLIVAVHAESEGITKGLAHRLRAQGRSGVQAFLDSRPIGAELEAIQRAISFAEASACALHIVHVSSSAGVLLVAEAQARGLDVSCETCPHYLAFNEDDLYRLGALAKCAPPLRPKAEQAALWRLLEAGTLPMIASDHSPAPPELKGIDPISHAALDPSDSAFDKAWGGISGCQSSLAVLLSDGYAEGKLSLGRIAEASAGYVARRFKLANKGRIAVGYDADLVAVDLDQSYTLSASELQYRHRHSPYLGRSERGKIQFTLLRGETIYQQGATLAPRKGRFVRPQVSL